MIYHLIRMAVFGAIAGVVALVFCMVKHYERKRIIYITLLAAYIGALAGLELFKVTIGVWPRTYQLIPLVTVINNIRRGNTTYIVQMIASIVVFIPLGVFIRIKRKSIRKVIVYGFLVSLVMEALQFVLRVGTFDVDDIILNVLGAVIGFVLTSRLVSTKQLSRI